LPLGLEAGNDLARVHARLENLQGDLAAERLLLLGHEDDAEAAFADLLQQLVRPDHRAGAFADGGGIDRGDGLEGWGVAEQELPRRLIGPDQPLDPRPPAGVPGAGPIEEGRPCFRRTVFHGLAEQGHDLTLWFVHDDPPPAPTPPVNARSAG